MILISLKQYDTIYNYGICDLDNKKNILLNIKLELKKWSNLINNNDIKELSNKLKYTYMSDKNYNLYINDIISIINKNNLDENSFIGKLIFNTKNGKFYTPNIKIICSNINKL